MTSKFRFSILASAILFAALALGAGGPAAAQADPPGFARALAAKDANIDRLMAIDGVVGAGVGRDASGRAVIVVTTARAGVAGIARSLDGVAVRVMVTGPFFANPKPDCEANPGHPSCKDGGGGEDIDPTAKFPAPAPIGVSTGNEGQCSSGTIGARLTDSGGNLFALSNNHVYALGNFADIGPSATLDDSPSDTILQPGLFDTNCDPTGSPLGVLFAFEPILYGGADNWVDAAIAIVKLDTSGDPMLGQSTPADGYGTPSSVPATEYVGQPVMKYGRTTGETHGTVAIIDWDGWIGYSAGNAWFVGQIVVGSNKGAFIKAGDSGSLLVTDDGNNDPVGLLFAGNRSGQMAIANQIGAVLDAFSLDIDGSQ